MAIFRNRFASTSDNVLVFAACAFPVYTWSILNLLREVPAWILKLSLWDLIGAIAYTQAFALVESVMILLVLMLLAFVLPARYLRNRFAAQGSMMVFLTSGWVIAGHYNDQTIRSWQFKDLLLWGGLYLFSLGVSYVSIRRYKRFEEAINSFVERLTVLLYVYVPLSLLSIAIVIFRNIYDRNF